MTKRFLPCLAACVFLSPHGLIAADWRPVTPADLALKPPKDDPSADVEVLFRDVRILNEAPGGHPRNIVTEYIRMKIFSDRGKDKYASVEIPYWDKNSIYDVEGRTIHPDGTVIDLKKDAVFEKDAAKKNRGHSAKVIAFALPSVEPGSIIEYRWKKNPGEFISRYIPLDVQTDYPVDEVTFHVKPLTSQYVQIPQMRMLPFRCNPGKIEPESDGFSAITLHNVPAFHEEPYMPPELSVKQWILVYYEENTNAGKDKFWTSLSREHYKAFEARVKVNGDAKAIAAEIISGAASDDDKIARIYDYCHKTLKDVHGSQITTEERELARENRTTADTIKHKSGTKEDIRLAFVALLQAAGFQARIAEMADRTSLLFDPAFQSAYFLNKDLVAVHVNDSWKFYDVNNEALAAGQLRWEEQGVLALIDDPKESGFVKTPILSATQTEVQRVGAFALSEEGNLEGDVREIRTGNQAMQWREDWANTNDAEREDALREQLKKRFAEFELTNVKYTASPNANMPVGVSYHIVVHGYAQRTGKRLFLNPNFFAVGTTARFTSNERHQPIYFAYPWTETESINWSLPPGFELDHPDFPGGYKFPPLGSYVLRIAGNTKRVNYARTFSFGGDDFVAITAEVYPNIKNIFDKVYEADTKLLTLKVAAPPAAGN